MCGLVSCVRPLEPSGLQAFLYINFLSLLIERQSSCQVLRKIIFFRKGSLLLLCLAGNILTNPHSEQNFGGHRSYIFAKNK